MTTCWAQNGFLTWSRRRFLQSAAALSALGYAFDRSAAAAGPAQRQPPYLALEKFIQPGSDEFAVEKEAAECRSALESAFEKSGPLLFAADATGHSPCPVGYRAVSQDVKEAIFDSTAGDLQAGWLAWRRALGEVSAARFYVLPDHRLRYEISSQTADGLAYRVGFWNLVWNNGNIQALFPIGEHVTFASHPWFRDVTSHALEHAPELEKQFNRGVPYWRSRLDPASGIDIYGSNGIAVGDVDGDGFDEVYVCQPGGLPNRLLKIHPDGRAEDLTRSWGLDLLDDTSCALFLDLRNTGRQDLVVLRSAGPVLFLHQGDRYRLRTDAFQFAKAPLGNFTGMAAADFDRSGKLGLYLCCYVYFQSEAQYTYASPYYDAENGPPNFLFRNDLTAGGGGAFIDCTAESGMDQNNNRFSFAPAWCDYNADGWPDLYVANDFGRKNLYRNNNGKFQDVAAEAGVEDIGPGMSASWFDYDGDGRPDLYVANMWTASGQRVVADTHFQPAAGARDAYRAHTMGNSLFRNRGNNTFEDATERQNVSFGRWAWSSAGHDLDNDGHPEIFVTCGMLSNESPIDLNSFFWRQVVARSPAKAGRSDAYENGWNAINQFVREDFSWSGHEPNVLHVKRGDRYFDFSGVSGLDYADDSRAFAMLDFDGDGRPDIVLKSRLGPQIRLLQNACPALNQSLAFKLRGTKSNRDAIGAKVQVDGQTKWLEAGSGFLSQNSKRLLFGLGPETMVARNIEIVWPSGSVQRLSNLKAGYTYSIVEGESEPVSEPFREHLSLPSNQTKIDNSLRLEDTWFMAPVPLPSPQKGPGLFVVREPSAEFEIFRRYLFDWRAPLKTPLSLLLNSDGEALKVYAAAPSAAQVAADLRSANREPLPFRGFYIKQPRRDYFKFGAAYLWAGLPQQALPYLERVIKQTPENARVLILLGQIHLEEDRVAPASDAFTKAARLDTGAVNAWIGLGDVAAKQGRNKDAGQNYSKALELDPQSAEAANGLGLALAKQGELSKAQTYFEQAITQRRDYAEAINNLAVLFSQQGKMNDAIAAWNYGIQVAPNEAILYLNLGRAYIGLGQNEKARMTMQLLLDHDSNNPTARRALQELSGR